MPLSGDVVRSISPWTALFSPIGNQLGVININLGQSSDPDVEQGGAVGCRQLWSAASAMR
jgi:hypothetical protein